MTNFAIDSELDFGKYVGKTLKEVFEINTEYIEWCMIHVDFFELKEETIDALKKTAPGFNFSLVALDANEEKRKPFYPDYDPLAGYGRSYEEYGGGPTGYLSDDFINDALDGDPDAYWNID